MPFDQAGYAFIGLLIIAFIGFMPTYFYEPVVLGQAGFNGYVHLHAVMMITWLLILIAQPFLIRSGQRKWHHRIGTFSYFFFPLLVLSMVLMMNAGLKGEELPVDGMELWLPLKDLLIIVPCFAAAMYFRKQPALHARFIIGSTMQLIEPGLARASMYYIDWPSPMMGYLLTIIIIDVILIILIVKDRKAKQGRWVFPLVLAGILCIQAFIMLGGPQTEWFGEVLLWFRGLPLT